MLAVAAAPRSAAAQDFGIPARTLAPLFTQAAVLEQDADVAVRTMRQPADRGVLLPLYLSFATLQVLDAHSTVRAVRAGGVEQNPLVGSLAGRPAGLFALKAGVAVSTIVLADKVRVRSRAGAIILMAALNSVYGVVVARNYSIR